MTSINDMVSPYRSRLAALADQELLDSLSNLQALPDESDPRWDEENSTVWDLTGELLAHADEVAARRLARGVALLLEKACFGDPGETMRGLRHSFESAVDADWAILKRPDQILGGVHQRHHIAAVLPALAVDRGDEHLERRIARARAHTR